MIEHAMPFVAGSYGAAVAILAFIAGGAMLRYRTAKRRLAAVEPRGRLP